jgi:hypothetical protein
MIRIGLLIIGMIMAMIKTGNAKALENKYLLCVGKDRFSGVRVDLDSSNYRKGSGYVALVNARVQYQYSSTTGMVCLGVSRLDRFKTNCVGYYYSGEITEIKVRTESSGEIYVYWTTNQAYGQIKKKTRCQLMQKGA